MSEGKVAVKIGIGVALGVVLSVGVCKLLHSARPNFAFMRNAEVVYTGSHPIGKNRSMTTDMVANIPETLPNALRQIEEELPQAIRRNDGNEGTISFAVPQFENGRMQIDEYPEQLIKIRPGRVIKKGSKLMVMNDTAKHWSHVEIADYRGPSALDSAFNWIGEKIGI